MKMKRKKKRMWWRSGDLERREWSRHNTQDTTIE